MRVTVTNGWRQRTIEQIEAIEGWAFDSERRLTWWGRWELTFVCAGQADAR